MSDQQQKKRTARGMSTRPRHVYDEYQDRWEKILHDEAGKLFFHDIPWPVLKEQVNDLSTVTEENITRFLMHPTLPKSRDNVKNRLHIELRRWHPDKFEAFVRRKVHEVSQEDAKKGSNRVTRCIYTLLGTCSSDWVSGSHGLWLDNRLTSAHAARDTCSLVTYRDDQR